MSAASLRTWSTAAIVALLLIIALMTLGPVGAGEEDGGDTCALGLPCLLGHFVLFGALGAALAVRYATSEAARRAPGRTLLAVIFGLWLLAAADEIAQGWVGRDPQLQDWLADMAGGLLGFLGAGAFARVSQRLRR